MFAWCVCFALVIVDHVQSECNDDTDVLHIDWQALSTEGSSNLLNWPAYEYNITFDHFNMEVVIDAYLSYLGYSVDKDEEQIGTTYVLDFASDDAEILPLNEPGTCSNRLASDFADRDFTDWWSYSTASPPVVGDAGYLAYPPFLGTHWFMESMSCSSIHVRGHFSYKALFDECTSYDGSRRYSTLTTDDRWINLTLTFYINVVSPLTLRSNTGFYRAYQLVSAPFVVAIHKTIMVLEPIGINLFTMSILAVYKEDAQSDFVLVVITESAEYLKLSNASLVVYPWDLENEHGIQFQVNKLADADNACLHNKAYMCSQIFEIYAENVPCPPSNFSGLYGMQFSAECNDAESSNETVNAARRENCLRWFNTFEDGVVDLSVDLWWSDTRCDPLVWTVTLPVAMRVYADEQFTTEAADDELFRVGVDRVFVEVELEEPSGAYQVFGAEITNVWLCTTDPVGVGEPALNTHDGSGGCLAGDIDDDGPYYIIQNYDATMLYNATHLDSASLSPNVRRFSFVVPESIVRDTLYIHAQLNVYLQDDSVPRRLLGIPSAAAAEGGTNQIRHYIASVSNVDASNAKPYQYIKDIEAHKRDSDFYDAPIEIDEPSFFGEGGVDDDYVIERKPEPWSWSDGPYILVSQNFMVAMKLLTVVLVVVVMVNVCFVTQGGYNNCSSPSHYLAA